MTGTAARVADAAARLGVALVPGTARADGSGWDFSVVHVADEDGTDWILRYPRRPEAAARARVEARVLARVRDHLDVAVPRWVVHEPDLIAYRRLPGVPAGAEDPVLLRYRWRIDPVAARREYLAPLCGLLATVHEITDVAGLTTRGVDRVRERLSADLDRAETALPVRAEAVRRWRRWLGRDRGWPPHPVLVHGDVHPGHTLVRSSDAKLIGMLDWADAEIGDPSADFADMCFAGGAAVLDAMLAHYRARGGSVWPGMREHVLARCSFLWVKVGLRGLDTGRDDLVATASRRLRAPA
ncbi:macrolide 2'-phosphotransferase [Saccharopolyspora gregorii]|uniref:Macrolide 2'-phosphotransferase MphH n=1 Tax=Saccharopolyspora gregorii TaxID=33914 RepID=A0ABP6RRZ2_9PSEU